MKRDVLVTWHNLWQYHFCTQCWITTICSYFLLVLIFIHYLNNFLHKCMIVACATTIMRANTCIQSLLRSFVLQLLDSKAERFRTISHNVVNDHNCHCQSCLVDTSSTKTVERVKVWQGNGLVASDWGAATYLIWNGLSLPSFLTKACLFT